MNQINKILVLGCALLLAACSQNSQADEREWETIQAERVSIHDPSVFTVTDKNGEKNYYLFGSHMAQAKTKDFLTWEVPFMTEYENMDDNLILGNVKENLRESFEWAGYDDADCSGGYALWAPDVVWNPDYKWDDGTFGAYMYYYSASSTWRRSCIGFAVSKNLEGQYKYGGTIVYSGFSKEDATDGSDRNIHYKNTHIPELIKQKKIDGFNEKWVKNDKKTYNTDYAPNAIDPGFFEDEDNKLWMVYGSWSGGIFLLEIEKETGLPIYPGKDSVTEDGRLIDRYFGIKIAGGYHQSGEGPYIQYDPTNGYYYLFTTYGGLGANGGYNMRLFRSKNATGPYLDAKGNTPIFSATDKNDHFGIKIMGNYKLSNNELTYKSEGHNSAFIDDDGQWYLIYHTRFAEKGEAHEIRVHQMFMNDNDWPVTAPFEYDGIHKTLDKVTSEDCIGEYELINHGTQTENKILPVQKIYLLSDGKIEGKSGYWEIYDDYKMKLVLDDIQYTGVFLKQNDESKDGKEVLTFTTIGENNETIWGVKKHNQ